MGMWMMFVCLWKQILIMMTFEFPFPSTFLYSLLPFSFYNLGIVCQRGGGQDKGEAEGLSTY